MSNETSVKQRQSGIELLKIIAMVLIVIAHCVQTIAESDKFVLHNINIVQPTKDIAIFALQIFYYFGVLGNSIFFISSAWFLVDSSNIKLNKIMYIVLNNIAISVIFMLIFLGGGYTYLLKI